MKRFLSILLATVVLFSLPACEDKALSESLKAEETYVDSMVGEMPSDEYDRAIWYGFVGQELSRNKNRTVTWREYCTMIGAMLSLKDEILCAQWQELASLALNSDDEMVGPNVDSVVQNCEIAWGGGCVQIVENGKVCGQMGDAINGCGKENCSIIGNYVHDAASSALIIESYSNVQFKDISVSGNLIERTSNGINISGNENVSFENVSFNDNIFYLTGASAMGMHDIRSGQMVAGEWTACFRTRDPYEYTDCTISGNKMYYPLYFFYYCDVPVPEMSDNLYVPATQTLGFADIRYDFEVGPFLPAGLDESENIMKNVFGDTTSIVQ